MQTLHRLGYEMTGFERHPVPFLLLNSALRSVDGFSHLAEGHRLGTGVHADLKGKTVYYDPMFSDSQKSLPKKEMAWFAELVGPDMDAEEFDLLCEYRFLANQDDIVQHTVYFSQVSEYRLSYRAGVILYVIDFDARSDMLGLLPDTDEELSREGGTLQQRC